MRVLFTVIPEKTIFLSMVPLAWAMRTAGHEVLVASQPRFASVITQAGLTAVPVGRDLDPLRLARLRPGQVEAERAGLHPPWDVAVDPGSAAWDRLLPGHVDAVALGHQPDNVPMIAGLVEFARHWRPDLVIWEPLSYAGGIAARASGAAHARLLWSLDVFGVTRYHFLRVMAGLAPELQADPLADWLAGYGRKYGFDYGEDLALGQFTIDQLPASLRMATDLRHVSMQYIPYGGPAVVPDWLRAPPDRPRIALTLGTTAADVATFDVPVADILEALADLDLEVVATLPDAEQRRLPRIPDNARVVPFVPLHALVPTCAAVVNHAGPGTLLTTARYGVPQLTLPWSFDEPELARRTAAQGAALVIHAGRATGARVTGSVLRLLREPGFRDHAVRLRDEIRALPTPHRLVPRIEELAAEHRPAAVA